MVAPSPNDTGGGPSKTVTTSSKTVTASDLRTPHLTDCVTSQVE